MNQNAEIVAQADENIARFYDGWTQHILTILPSFDGFTLSISGVDRNQIKEYLHETYYHALMQMVDLHAMPVNAQPQPEVSP